MVIFNSYVCLPEGTHVRKINSHMLLHPTGDSAGTCQEFRRAGDDPCQGKCKPQVLPTHERSLKKVTRFMNIWGRPTITACPENNLFPIFVNVESKCLEANVEKDRICIDFATRAAGTWYLKKWFKIPSIGFRQLHPTSSNFPMDNWSNYLDFKSENLYFPKFDVELKSLVWINFNLFSMEESRPPVTTGYTRWLSAAAASRCPHQRGVVGRQGDHSSKPAKNGWDVRRDVKWQASHQPDGKKQHVRDVSGCATGKT